MKPVTQEILTLFAEKGALNYGEDVSQQEHALQTAALAEKDDCRPELIAACLLHDIGHLKFSDAVSVSDIDEFHERLGASWLKEHFSKAVTEPVRLHVLAKRYLCSVGSNYYTTLSPASKYSMELQGGIMDFDEQERFERNPWHKDAIALRRYDDAGKVSGLAVRPIEDYVPLLDSLLSA